MINEEDFNYCNKAVNQIVETYMDGESEGVVALLFAMLTDTIMENSNNDFIELFQENLLYLQVNKTIEEVENV